MPVIVETEVVETEDADTYYWKLVQSVGGADVDLVLGEAVSDWDDDDRQLVLLAIAKKLRHVSDALLVGVK
jgi:hypothetical protein